jgi:glycosyltransferase involved in cell wall biosynthesis
VHEHEGENWDLNKNVGMEAASSDWLLLVDADEMVPPRLADEIMKVIRQPCGHDAYRIPRREMYFGRHAKRASSDSSVLRVFRRGAARFGGEHLHEDPNVTGAIGHLHQFLIHYPYESVKEYVAKTNEYTDHEARYLWRNGQTASVRQIIFEPMKLFRYRYLKLQGYRDGMHGLVYSAVTSLYPFLQYVKLWELQARESSRESNADSNKEKSR